MVLIEWRANQRGSTRNPLVKIALQGVSQPPSQNGAPRQRGGPREPILALRQLTRFSSLVSLASIPSGGFPTSVPG